jgi:rubrerythrin
LSISLNAIEVFEIAERIERNSVNFYRKAAEAASDEGTSQILSSLAEFEKEHQRCYANMRKQISAKELDIVTFDPENGMAIYLEKIADSQVFNPQRDPAEQMKEKRTIRDILEYAVEAEKDSIIFYLGLKNYLTATAVKNKVDEIINEEMNHITELNLRLSALKYIEKISTE